MDNYSDNSASRSSSSVLSGMTTVTRDRNATGVVGVVVVVNRQLLNHFAIQPL